MVNIFYYTNHHFSRLLLGLLLTAGILLVCGCSAESAVTDSPASSSELFSANGEACPEDLSKLRQSLQKYVKTADEEVYRSWWGGDLDKLTEDASFDSLKLLGKSNGWSICLWKEGPVEIFPNAEEPVIVPSRTTVFGDYVVADRKESYYPSSVGIYFIKDDEVWILEDAARKNIVDENAVYHMLPQNLQWCTIAEYKALAAELEAKYPQAAVPYFPN